MKIATYKTIEEAHKNKCSSRGSKLMGEYFRVGYCVPGPTLKVVVQDATLAGLWAPTQTSLSVFLAGC